LDGGNIVNIHKEMWDLALKLDKMQQNGYYSSEDFIKSIQFQINQLSFFYDNLVPKQGGGDPGKTFYNLDHRPKEHQILYANLTRGFPKELYDVHYCYLLKDCETKFIVIPTTSIKSNSLLCNNLYEKDIEMIDGSYCRLNIDDIRVIDLMRIIQYKGYSDVKTDRKDILNFVNNFFSDIVDNNEIVE